MFPVTILNSSIAVGAKHPVSVRRVRGNFNGADQGQWLFLIDAAPGVAIGTVAPKIAPVPLYVGAGFYVDESHGSLEFQTGLIGAISSTQETFTAAVAGDKMDITFELDEPEEPSGTTFTGDLSTTVDSLLVYADGSTTTNLYSIVATNIANAGPALYLQLFTAAAPAAGSVPFMEWTFSDGQSRKFVFGKQGIHPIQGPVGAETQGVYLFGSTTPGIFTASTGGQWTIQAEYGAPQNG